MATQNEKAAEILATALKDVWKPSGVNWVIGAYHSSRYSSKEGVVDTYCLIGGIDQAAQKLKGPAFRTPHYRKAVAAVNAAIQRKTGIAMHIPVFNDSHAHGFSDVKAVVCDAIKHLLPKKRVKKKKAS